MTYSMLGHPRRGRLGNQLFQIASTIGLAIDNGHKFVFPDWKYAQYFEEPWPLGKLGNLYVRKMPEAHFHHDGRPLTDPVDYDIDGWRQSLKYWQLYEPLVRMQFTFAKAFEEKIRKRFAKALQRPCIAISVRRGDFVGNPNYAQLPASYYYLALFEQFPDWADYNIIFFSDDIPYCRVHFEGLPGAYFADGTDIEQLCLMSQCQHFIVSNSTFSWWGAYLGEKEDTRVIRPNYLFDGDLKKNNSDRDYWPARWEVFDHVGKRLDLRDVTFTIPVYIDHNHRRQNVALTVCMLQRDLDTNIIIGEQGSRVLAHMAKYAQYVDFGKLRAFHRTRMLNEMAQLATTGIVVNYDCDVVLPPIQLWLAAEKIRNGNDMVYPYDGRFARVPRTWFPKLEKALDLGIFGDTKFTGKNGHTMATTSVGGAIMFNRQSFLNGGGENEFMISFGPEDWERNYRFKALGYTVTRVDGSLYHMDHWCGPNSSSRNPYFRQNHNELDKVRAMKDDELEAYVTSWPWR